MTSILSRWYYAGLLAMECVGVLAAVAVLATFAVGVWWVFGHADSPAVAAAGDWRFWLTIAGLAVGMLWWIYRAGGERYPHDNV